jgi:signal transduction histidine kinase/CheY-like chemotaxis protein
MDIKNNYRSADGELQIEISISSLYHGGITGAVIRMDDVTVIKKKDEKLSQAQMMDSIGNLAGGIAHDFNNVLSGITGTVSLLKHRLSKNELKQNDLEKFLNVIDDSGKRAVTLTRQILSLSRKDEMTLEPADLNEILRHVYNFCFHSFEKSIEIRADYYPEPARAAVDSTRIEQVILNLCINAGDSMTVMRPDNEKRGGTLNIGIERFPSGENSEPLPVEAESGRDYWKITVKDNGIGMDKKTMERIFEPFFTTKAKGRGTGLGLAMVYNIIHNHNGFINVSSDIGQGSLFSLYLPADKSGAIKQNKLQPDFKSGKGKILVIDDEESICDISKEILEYCGYEVTVEINPEAAVKRYSENEGGFACIILDLNMPKKNGFEVLRHIKADYPDAKVIISSGSISDEKMQTLSSAGADAFITKPYTLESLAKIVSDVIP